MGINQPFLQMEVELQAVKEELRRERDGHSETRQRLATAEKVRRTCNPLPELNGC